MKKHLISIIIPTFNRIQLIEETLNSIIFQTYTNWECIIVDDGSTDNSVEVITSYCKTDARFKLFRRPKESPKGANTCRNFGMKHAKGDYLLFLDSDDLLKKDCLENRIQEFQKHTELDFLVFQSELFNDIPGDLGKIPNILTKSVDDLSRFISLDYPWNISAGIFKKSYIESNNVRWDERFTHHQDIDFYVHLLTLKPEYKKIDVAPDVFIRMGSDDKISNQPVSDERLNSKIQLIENIKNYIIGTEFNSASIQKRLYGLAIHYAKLFEQESRKDLILKTSEVLRVPHFIFRKDIYFQFALGSSVFKSIWRFTGAQKRIKYAGMKNSTLAKYSIEEEKYHDLKVVHISTQESGGAGLAAARLHKGLQKLHIPSSFLTLKKTTVRDETVVNFKNPKPSFFQKVWNRFFRTSTALKNQGKLNSLKGKHEGFSFATSDYKIHEHPLVKEAAIIHLHWVVGFVDYPSFFKNIDKPIVWTLHDMNPFQGGFHYKNDELRNASVFGKLNSEIKKIKQKAYKESSLQKVVCPSQWLKHESENSELLKGFSHAHIYNGVDETIFCEQDQKGARLALNISLDKKVILFVSESVDNERKQLETLIEAFELLKNKSAYILMAIGTMPQIKLKGVNYIGNVASEHIMAQYYAAANVFVIPSLEDNLPNVMLESLLCGTPVIGTPVGGIKEVIKNEVNGILTKDCSKEGISEALEHFFELESCFNKSEISREAKKKFGLGQQSQKYIELYKKMSALK